MKRIIGNRITGRFTVACVNVAVCGRDTTTRYARAHNGQCKACAEPADTQHATREEQYSRYIDCGPAAWDDR